MRWLWLDPLWRLRDAALALTRLYVGGFLIAGVWDNIASAARMAEFSAFLAGLGLPLPALGAQVSVWAQFVVGVLLIPGLLTRWAGLLLAINFVVAAALLAGAGAGSRELFPPAILIFTGLLLASHGAGAWSVDERLNRSRRAPI